MNSEKMMVDRVNSVKMGPEFNKDEAALKNLCEFFGKTDEKELLQHEKCISSRAHLVEYQTFKDYVLKLNPVMLVEGGSSTVIALKKEPKQPNDDRRTDKPFGGGSSAGTSN